MEENQNQNVEENKQPSQQKEFLFGLEKDDTEILFVSDIANKIKKEIQKVIIGQDKTINLMLTCLFAGGNLLLEGVPGVAKTLMVKLLAKTIDTGFKRIQFTPDLMPSDVIGNTVFDMKNSTFYFREGPLFSNFILVDEVNRAPAKTQAALIEAMEEKQVSVDGTTYQLGFPLFIVATQNPIEQEGTYRLPEAQLDRFMFKIEVSYPNLNQEFEILSRFAEDFNIKQAGDVDKVCSTDDLKRCMDIIQNVHIRPELTKFIAGIVHNTRSNGDIFMGASPRASLAILKTSKALAAINGRNFVTPDDIRDVVYPAMNHRIILNPEREIEGVAIKDVILEIMRKIEVPL
jgi:MoxR-like ATPase